MYIRKAEEKDISRIAEILIFTKRMSYRSIFCNDKVSFGEMQVLPLAEEYLADKKKLENIWVYDDEFVKGLITLEEGEYCEQKELQIKELYVDSFFQSQGIGNKLMNFAIQKASDEKTIFLWVLEKNQKAINFYLKHGFERTDERKLEEGTTEYIVKFVR